MPESTGPNDLYLSDISERDKPWDEHRANAKMVQALYDNSDLQRYADRIQDCSKLLGFALEAQDSGQLKLRLQQARFCRVRQCPVCQWRRSLMWRAKFIQVLPKVHESYPTARWLFVTLTVKNCPLNELRATLQHMNKSWERLSKRKRFPALGFVKSTEVTRSDTGEAHPHFHCLLLVPSSYFSTGYISQADWTELWRQALRVAYSPVVDVKAVKPPKGGDQLSGVIKILPEILKYSTKESDLLSDAAWLHELTYQLHKTRSVSVGGVLREFLSDDEPEDLIHVEDEVQNLESDAAIWFGWREMIKRYAKTEP